MTDKRNKSIFALILVLVMSFLPMTALADEVYYEPVYEIRIDDQAELFTNSEEAMLYENLKKVATLTNVAVFTSTDYLGGTESFARWYSNNWLDGNGVVFIIDMDDRNLALDSSGNAYNLISDADCDTIMDNVYTYASKGDYYGCALETFDQVYKLMTGLKIPRPMKYIGNAIIALFAGFMISYMIVIKSVQLKKADINELADAASPHIKVTDFNEKFLKQTKVYISSSSSGGGHGGGGHHGGGGGGHHGGSHHF